MGDDSNGSPPRSPVPLLGSWARYGEFVGLVAKIGEDTVTLFDPGQRQVTEVAAGEIEPVPAGAVQVTIHAELPIAHGFDEERLRRWLTTLVDPLTRGRAAEALREGGIDEGAVLPSTRLSVGASTTSGAVCLCGARTPAPPGAAVPCASCGRQAVAAPPGGDGG